ncbi:hypothetical protein A6F49_04325 [Enteractinococcus helveticum]|uniref:GIY-YIG domain-containing protein n=2 Tax=Enteractinococcus helveticum TaxID=1837282 RepID=A0A1B7M2X8_9MICC|nr:hypothetical protein A6F49_04325 [Enteractinococcus helveticum]
MPLTSNKSTFDSYDVQNRSSFAPFVQGRSSGIYIFEFSNGEHYIGQTKNFAGRFPAHLRGISHHPPWDDITRLMVMDAAPADLDYLEAYFIESYKDQGYSLRNKVFNFGFEGPSRLDIDVPIIEQEHWANGVSDYDIADIREAADRPMEGHTKLHRSSEGQLPWLNQTTEDRSWPTVADAVCADLGEVMARAIPEAVELESIYWTVSDYPSTVGGRLTTLNVGSVEVLYIPRDTFKVLRKDGTPTYVHISCLNMTAGTLIRDGEILDRWKENSPVMPSYMYQSRYRIGAVDKLEVPTGFIGQALDHPEILQGVRKFCLDLMRSNQSGLFRRWHSRELARRAYEEHIMLTEQGNS